MFSNFPGFQALDASSTCLPASVLSIKNAFRHPKISSSWKPLALLQGEQHAFKPIFYDAYPNKKVSVVYVACAIFKQVLYFSKTRACHANKLRLEY